MNRAVTTLLLALPFLVASASAQTTPPPAPFHSNTVTVHTTTGAGAIDNQTAAILSHSAPTTLTIHLPPNSCPVGFRAQPGVSAGKVVIVSNDPTASQKLNLQFTNPAASIGIKHAQITVHGLTPHGRISPAAFDETAASTATRQVDFELRVAPGASASTDMLFEGFTSVQSIDLDSVTYTDGSTWHSSPQSACQIIPNRFMLVASH